MSPIASTMVLPEEWRGTVARHVDDGHSFLDLLTGVDRGERIEVIVRLVDVTTLGAVVVTTQVDSSAPQVDSVADLLPAATWHEREVAEMFGVHFRGHPDPRPLLLRRMPTAPPLLRSTPLEARLATPYPGTPPQDERRRARRQPPPGVLPDWLKADDR